MQQEPALTVAAACGSHLLPAADHGDLCEIEEGMGPQIHQAVRAEPKTQEDCGRQRTGEGGDREGGKRGNGGRKGRGKDR